MNDNRFAPPKSEVDDVGRGAPDGDSLYFSVSIRKYVVMSLSTFGLYSIYWFYKHWTAIKRREGSDILPVMRGIFAVFFCYQLIRHVRTEGEERGIEQLPNAGASFVLWLVLNLMSRAPDSLAFLSLLGPLVLIPTQICANRINELATPDIDVNDRFSAWNLVAIVIGVGCLLLVALGLGVEE